MMWYKTKVTEMLGITYPIIQAGMAGGVTTTEVYGGVSNSGGGGGGGGGCRQAEASAGSSERMKERRGAMMWYKTKVTEMLGITYPIIQAGMAGGVTTPELVAAVSNSGGLGSVGAGYMQAKAMQESIQHIKELTDQPFGVNIFVPEAPDVSPEEIKQANERLSPFR